ncbi:hypothetical protein BC829DRAFT_388054, partial [Chytridium lagenaria]
MLADLIAYSDYTTDFYYTTPLAELWGWAFWPAYNGTTVLPNGTTTISVMPERVEGWAQIGLTSLTYTGDRFGNVIRLDSNISMWREGFDDTSLMAMASPDGEAVTEPYTTFFDNILRQWVSASKAVYNTSSPASRNNSVGRGQDGLLAVVGNDWDLSFIAKLLKEIAHSLGYSSQVFILDTLSGQVIGSSVATFNVVYTCDSF